MHDSTTKHDDALSPRRTRRGAAQLLVSLAGGGLLLRAGWQTGLPRALAQEDDDSGSGRGRGRGRGRGGDRGDSSGPGHEDEREDDEQVVAPLQEIPAGSAEIHIISDDAGGFQPAELTVDAGQTVAFVNTHSDEHTATGSGFDTGIIAEGGIATVTLETPGRYAYACQIHPEMTGTVLVRDAEGNIPRQPVTPSPTGGPAVSIVNLTFQPAALTVAPGSTVVWTNDDSVPHTVTSVDGFFDSGIFDPGATFSWAFEEAGVFDYVCQLHPQMQGAITVEGQPIVSEPPVIGDQAAAASPSPTEQDRGDSGLTGVWLVELQPEDGASIGRQRALLAVHSDGSAEADFVPVAGERAAAMTLTAGHGESMLTGTGFTLVLAVLAIDANDRFTALVAITGEAIQAADSQSFQGTAKLSWFGSDGAEQAQISAVIAGQRALPHQ